MMCVVQGKMSGDAWEHIRSLDETENWHDRNVVISKADHQSHTTWARVSRLLHAAPFYSIFSPSSSPLSCQEVVEDMVDSASHHQ